MTEDEAPGRRPAPDGRPERTSPTDPQRLLLKINRAVSVHRERKELFHSIAEALEESIPFDRMGIFLRQSHQQKLLVYAYESHGESGVRAGTTFQAEGTIPSHVMDTQRPFVGSTLEDSRPFPVSHEVLRTERMVACCVLPLIVDEHSIGCLIFTSKTPRAFDALDLSLMGELSQAVAVALDNCLAYEEIARLKDQLAQENVYLREEVKGEFTEIVGRSPAIEGVLHSIELVAPTTSSVLVSGETGTGKELVARAIHGLSPRREKPLVKVNCASLPSGLIESELFGHERGAFTGALERRIGRFELARDGTIFLDEVGDLPLDLQSKLLRVLQEGEFERIGSTDTFKVDVRVIAATNKDLEAAVEEQRFRPDLYYRLSVFPIRIPPLRERKEDIPLLVRHFAMSHASRMGRKIERIARSGLRACEAYSWPGNVRELRNLVERGLILCRGPVLDLSDLVPAQTGAKETDVEVLTIDEVQRRHITRVLEMRGWRVSGPHGAATVLGMKPTTLEARMKRLGIRRPGRDRE